MTELATGLDLAENHAKAVLSEKADWRLGKAMARAGLGLISVCKADSHAAREHYDALKGMRGTIYYGIIADDRLLGILAHTMGELNQAVAHFEGALAFCRRGYWPELAWTCHDYAKTLLQRKTPSDHAMATDLLDESLSLSRQLGMKLLMERVISLQGRVRSHPVGSPAYPGGLTERQVEVLQLISQGKTNREIARELMLSERTVQRHIADIYAKISARNRADATAFALGKLYPVK
jgi:DNA-binding CsgD family transcriptional regulator